MNENTLRVSWTTNIGRDGVDDDDSNPFARSVHRLIRNGQPIDKTGLVLINCGVRQPDIRWLGVFSCTAGGHLSFFPGYAVVPEKYVSYRGAAEMQHIDKPIDHLTLEPNMQRWHATAFGSTRHFGGPSTLPVGGGRVLWFGASIAGPRALRALMKSTTVSSTVPPSDVERRRKIFEQAVDGVVTQLLEPPPRSDVDSQETYHCSVTVGPVGCADYTGEEHALPIGSPWLDGQFPQAACGWPVLRYRLTLGMRYDIQLHVMRLPCALQGVSITFTSPTVPQATSGAKPPAKD